MIFFLLGIDYPLKSLLWEITNYFLSHLRLLFPISIFYLKIDLDMLLFENTKYFNWYYCFSNNENNKIHNIYDLLDHVDCISTQNRCLRTEFLHLIYILYCVRLGAHFCCYNSREKKMMRNLNFVLYLASILLCDPCISVSSEMSTMLNNLIFLDYVCSLYMYFHIFLNSTLL